MKGIKDTKTVQITMGERLQKARDDKGLKRPTFVQLLQESTKAPVESRAKMTVDRLKQWEYGNNPVGLEWIPAICDVLGCDVGYLFGDYSEKTRGISDICAETGLSPAAVNAVCSLPKDQRLALNAVFESRHLLTFVECVHKSVEFSEHRGELIIEHIGQELKGQRPTVPAEDMESIFAFQAFKAANSLYDDATARLTEGGNIDG